MTKDTNYMKRLCFGTLLKILSQTHTEGISDAKLCESIFSVYGYETKWYEQELRSNVSKLKSSNINVPKGLSQLATIIDKETVATNFNEKVIPKLASNLYKPIIASIIAILKEDTTINDTDLIGFEGYTKKSIFDNNSYDIASFLAAMFQYAITTVENRKCKTSTSKIKKDYVQSFSVESKKISLLSFSLDMDKFSPIDRTINDEKFKEVFVNVSKNIVSKLDNPTSVSIYKFDLSNNTFKYTKLKDYLRGHISDYVCSRSQLLSLNDENANKKLITNAVIKFINNSKDAAKSALGEILIYIFLEQELNAPKLMSKIELKEDGDISKSDGIHLLSIPTKDGKIHQVVFGVSNIVANPKNAIDNAFNKILDIGKNEKNELKILDPTTLSYRFDENTTKYLLSLLRPNKNTTKSIDNAYGLFIGYTIDIEKANSNIDFRKKIDEKLNKDIKVIEKYIIQKIKDNNLEGYSFYVYVIPFNDAQKEKVDIMKEITSEV